MISAWVRRTSRECYRRDGKCKLAAVGQSIGAKGPWLMSIGVGVGTRSVAHTRGLGAREGAGGTPCWGWKTVNEVAVWPPL